VSEEGQWNEQAEVLNLRGYRGCNCTNIEQQGRKQYSGSHDPTGLNTPFRRRTVERTYAAATTADPNPDANKANGQIVNRMQPVSDRCSTGGDVVTPTYLAGCQLR
jgi:hypothetical protein